MTSPSRLNRESSRSRRHTGSELEVHWQLELSSVSDKIRDLDRFRRWLPAARAAWVLLLSTVLLRRPEQPPTPTTGPGSVTDRVTVACQRRDRDSGPGCELLRRKMTRELSGRGNLKFTGHKVGPRP
jgi:hypothetical protein